MTALPHSIRLPRPAPAPYKPHARRPRHTFDHAEATLVARCELFRSRRGRPAQKADTDDAVQELVAAAWQAWPRFDPARGRVRTFLANVMRRRTVSMVRTRLAQKRGGLRQQVWLEDSGESFAAADHADSTQLALDVADVEAKLPDELQHICILLRTHSVADTARALGMTRSALVHRLRIIGRAFEEAGLGGVQA